ncbi:MAG: TIGR01906 family membrane protein [Clostridia bacterium]|nr:TIGR01906 family membrane protein [Clostridia bacterium]
MDSLGIPQKTGYSKAEIIEAYDQVLDYLVLYGKEFGTGVFKWSEEGKNHFQDCKVLFDLNLSILIISLVIVVTIAVLHKKKIIKICRPFGYNFTFICGISTLVFFMLLGGICSIDFDTAFTIFHSIFFPGKDNWLFDSRKDQIILAMPQDFFMNCAILIASSIILISVGFIVYGIIEKKKRAS